MNAETTKYMITLADQNAGQNHNIKRGNKLSENLPKFNISKLH